MQIEGVDSVISESEKLSDAADSRDASGHAVEEPICRIRSVAGERAGERAGEVKMVGQEHAERLTGTKRVRSRSEHSVILLHGGRW
jgi:hypothetical protein